METTELKSLFSQEYNPDAWKNLVGQLFPDANFKSYEDLVERDTEFRKSITEKIRSFGSVQLADHKRINLYEVELKPGKNIGRNRVELRRLIVSELLPGLIDGSLVCFYDKEQAEWRFSFISRELVIDEKGKDVQLETEPKRFTYVFGDSQETYKTPIESFEKLLGLRAIGLKQLQEAFSVEKLSKDFFKGYQMHFRRFVQSIVENPSLFKSQAFNGKESTVKDFVKKLMGRIVFLWFLQKKGWLGLKEKQNYGEGSRRFMQELLALCKNEGSDANFYSQYLTPLFFDSLNNSKERLYKPTNSRVPFLNGGLFEHDAVSKAAQHLPIGQVQFSKFFEFLDHYNFTIDESDPDDVDVGIDPEMLGIIFENLLDNNHDSGTYYTPKRVVNYMCQEAIIQYLQQMMGELPGIVDFVRHKSIENENEEAFLKKHGSNLNKYLDLVKICDPAIGSGAFPMGLLQEIFKAKLRLNFTLSGQDKAQLKRNIIKNSIYGVDIEKGAVDIARLRFWLSLIVDEEVEKGKEPEPLPNLDFKIMQGDSLFESFNGTALFELEEQKEIQGTFFGEVAEPSAGYISAKDKEKIQMQIEKYFAEKDPFEKEKQKKTIDGEISKAIYDKLDEQCDKLEKEVLDLGKSIRRAPSKQKQKALKEHKLLLEQTLENRSTIEPFLKADSKPYFLWHLYFQDVFETETPGFDIIIGNPPYVRQEKIKHIKPYLQKVNGQSNYQVYNSTSDLYTYFFELGYNLLKDQTGVFSFITSKTYTRANAGQNLRKFLLEHTTLTGYLDFDEVNVFDATVNTSVIFFRKKAPQGEYTFPFCRIKNDLQPFQPLHQYTGKKQWKFSSKYLAPSGWAFFMPLELDAVREIEDRATKLVEWPIRMNFGIKTGLNKAFWIDEETKEQLVQQNPKSGDIIKPLLRGKDVSKFKTKDSKIWVLFTRRGIEIDDFPSIRDYLNEYYEDLKPKKKEDKRGRKPGPYKWYEIQDNVAFFEDFESPKLVWGELSDVAKFTYDDKGYYADATCFIMVGNHLKYILAVLNSQLSNWYFDKITTISGMGTNRWKKTYLNEFRIPLLADQQMRIYDVLVDYLLYLHDETSPRVSAAVSNELMAYYFNKVLDGCVFEAYFPDHIREIELSIVEQVNEDVQEIAELVANKTHKAIAHILEQVYRQWREPGHPVFDNIQMYSVRSEKLAIIENFRP